MRVFITIAAFAAVTASASADAITLNGGINPSEDWTQFLNSRNVQVFVATDATSLYFGVSTPDSGVAGNRTLDLNFGLDGNTGPWRYRVQSKGLPSYVRASVTSQPFSGGFTNGWSGFFDKGDDSSTEPGQPYHPNNWGDLGAGLVEYSVGINNGRREHEFAIPWSILLDGQNGWNYNSALTLRVAGYYIGTEGTTPFGNSYSWGAGPDGGVNFAVQSTYAPVNITTPIPTPGTAVLAGLGGLLATRRRR